MKKLEYPKGFKPLDIFISSIRKERVTSALQGSNVTHNHGAVHRDREITLKIGLEAENTKDYRLLRDETFALLDNYTGETYVSESHQPAKRYLVAIDEPFIPERIPNNQTVAEITVPCIKLGLPFAESIVTSSYIDKNSLKYNDIKPLAYGLGYSNHENEYIYSNTFESFRIFNPGTAAVELFEQDLRIEITNASDSNFKMTNLTTGDLFEVKVPVKRSDRIEIKGAKITINYANGLRKTNRGFISLAPGWNYFELSSNAKTNFDFRFYYK